MSAVSISNKLNIAPSTASESAMRGQKIVEEHGWKILEEAKSVNPRNVPYYSITITATTPASTATGNSPLRTDGRSVSPSEDTGNRSNAYLQIIGLTSRLFGYTLYINMIRRYDYAE